MLINTTQVVDRGNRPQINQIVGLLTYFVNDGAYVDPYEISSVSLFKESDTLSPNTVLDATTNLVNVTPLMTFAASGTNTSQQCIHCTKTITTNLDLACDGAFNVTNYNPGITASGIYRLSQGQYAVVLDETRNLSGYDWNTSTTVVASSVATVGEYVDMWAVKLTEASKYQVLTNRFSLTEDTFFAFTEPLLLTTRNELLNKHVRLGEKIDLKVTTETTLQNKNIPRSIQNIFKQSVVTSATITIDKVNYDTHLKGPFDVKTDQAMMITSDNTLIYNWDTTGIPTTSGFGSQLGTYSVQVTYNILNQKFISPMSYITVS